MRRALCRASASFHRRSKCPIVCTIECCTSLSNLNTARGLQPPLLHLPVRTVTYVHVSNVVIFTLWYRVPVKTALNSNIKRCAVRITDTFHCELCSTYCSSTARPPLPTVVTHRAPDCQWRGRWFNPTYRRFETWAISLTSHLPASFGRHSKSRWSLLSGQGK